MSDPTLPNDELLRSAREYLAHMSSQPPPRDLEEDAITYAFSRRRRFSLAALLGGSAVIVAGSTAAVVVLAFHHGAVAGIPAVSPVPSASSGPTPVQSTPAVPSASPSVQPTPGPTPSAPVLVVSQYGFKMSLSQSMLDATYRIDHSFDGTHTDANGARYTTVGDIYLSTRSIQATPGCGGNGQRYWYTASIEVFSADPRHLSVMSGSGRFIRIGQYWLGYSSPQYLPYGANGPTCAQAPSAVRSFSNAYNTITPSP